MRLDNPSQLGPWNRYQETHEIQHHNQYSNRYYKNPSPTNFSFNQDLMFPRVTVRKKYIVTIRQSKQKNTHPINVKPLQIDLKDRQQNQNNENQGNKFRTISYDPPMISFYNKRHPKLNKNRNKNMWQSPFQEYQKRGLGKQTNSLHKVSKVDLLANYIENGQVNQIKSPKFHKGHQYQFSKKRSLIELLKYLKNSPSKTALTSRNKNQSNGNPSLRYEDYRQKINMSLQAQPKYLPYFQTRKSHYSKK